MELDKFEQKQVAAISELQATSNQLQGVAKNIKVVDNETLKEANQVIKDINAHKKLVKEKRLALTQPLNNVVNQLIAKEKEVLLPLDEGKTELSDKIISYSEEVVRKRIQEINRITDIIDGIESYLPGFDVTQVDTIDSLRKQLKEHFEAIAEEDKNNPSIKVAFMTTVAALSDRKNQIIEEQRAEAERQRQAEEQKKLDAEREKQSAEEARLAEERRANEEAKRQIEEEKLQMQREKEELERAKEIQKAEAEALKLEKARAKVAKAAPKTNQITTLNYEIYDEDLVPREYCSPDMTKIRTAVKFYQNSDKPFEIPGVKVSTETKVR